MRAQEFLAPITLAKIEATGQIVQLVKHADQVGFSDKTGWFLINVKPGQTTGPSDLNKWIPDSTRFAWVREFANEKEALSEYRTYQTQYQGLDMETRMFGRGVIQVRAYSQGRELGYVTLELVDRDTRTVVSQDLEVDERYRGQGIAQLIYDYIRDQGYTIQRSGAQTTAGRAFWDKNRGEESTVWENFADGKNPGRKGLSRRVGIPKKATLGKLEKIAKSSSGEKRRMAQWQLNMRRGKKK